MVFMKELTYYDIEKILDKSIFVLNSNLFHFLKEYMKSEKNF